MADAAMEVTVETGEAHGRSWRGTATILRIVAGSDQEVLPLKPGPFFPAE